MTAPDRAYRHRRVICFEDTNVVGNVYFARHVAWQGACREMFLRDHAPETLEEIARDLRLVTLSVSCEYFEELRAFDEVELVMTLDGLDRHRISLAFDYRARRGEGWRQVARGAQAIGCMRDTPAGLVPTDPPPPLRAALEAYRRA